MLKENEREYIDRLKVLSIDDLENLLGCYDRTNYLIRVAINEKKGYSVYST